MEKARGFRAHRRLAERFQEALRRARNRRLERAVLARPPRYDEVFAQGAAWLDRLASDDRRPLSDPGESGR